MRKYILAFAVVGFSFHSLAQAIDTLFLSHKKMADTIFDGVKTKAPTGFLQNRLFIAENESMSGNSRLFHSDTTRLSATADMMFGLINELHMMATENSSRLDRLTIFNSVGSYVGQNEFEKEIYIYPIGIVDYRYNVIDVEEGVSEGILGRVNNVLTDLNPENYSITTEKRATLIGPLFDYHDSEIMGLVFRKEDYSSNFKSSDDVQDIFLFINDRWVKLDWDKQYFFKPGSNEEVEFKVKIVYKNNEEFQNKFKIQTPFKSVDNIGLQVFEWFSETLDSDDDDCGWNLWDPGCRECGIISDENDNSIKWCFIPGCYESNVINNTPIKPYILVAGWRPPIFGQSFKKTWKIYNDEHGELVLKLNRNDYDIILIKFNIHTQPNDHGMIESAELLEKFLIHLNDNWKTDKRFENVIHGSSMGSDIIRLTLLTMEKKHQQDNSYPHHHCRLNIAHDGNFYGANIPFAYQCQILSSYHQSAGFPVWLLVPGVGIYYAQRIFLETMLYSTLEQKSYKELLTYHPLGSTQPYLWSFNNEFDVDVIPKHHNLRQQFYNKLLTVDNGKHIFPMPIASRNIATSLGKISGLNSDNNFTFNPPGAYWHNLDVGIYKFRLGAAKYMPPGQNYQIFKRQKVGITLNPFSLSVKHIVNVTLMQELDNCAGSYLTGFGNIIALSDWTYFTPTIDMSVSRFFNHKSTLTALGINKNLWPANGSHSLNMQSLGLMYINKQANGILVPSNHFGYPHLGRPTDHYQVTPFDAIYVDNEIDPHIKLEGATTVNRDATNLFFLDEVEPWYLGLQNQQLGSQARANYTYRAYRIARNAISVGYHVTPTTPDGDYTIEPNAVLNLRAGETIELKTGTHFKPGSEVHLKIEYFPCTD